MSRFRLTAVLVLAISVVLTGSAHANDTLCMIPFWPHCS